MDLIANATTPLPLLRLLLFLGFVVLPVVNCVPSGFVNESVADVVAIAGTFAPNPRNGGKPMLLLSAKTGTIHVLEDPDNSDHKFTIAKLDGITCNDGERGLQSIRPHPNFASNRYLYVFYSRLRNGCTESATDGPSNRVSRFTMNASTLMIDLSTEHVLLETPPTPIHNHNGGSIAFGNDGKLWVTTGDGGSKDAVSQDLGHLLGKILRLNDDGSIPSDNPYATGGVTCGKLGGKTTNGACGEMYVLF
jgi:glucose/arabinose dehydrogenase